MVKEVTATLLFISVAEGLLLAFFYRLLGLARSDAHLAREEARRYLAGIRRHRDYRGDDRCHQDDHELYLLTPEGDTRPERETAVTLENCQRYIECRQAGREYVGPQRRIDELEVEVAYLKAQYHAACDRIGVQSEMLSALAERGKITAEEMRMILSGSEAFKKADPTPVGSAATVTTAIGKEERREE